MNLLNFSSRKNKVIYSNRDYFSSKGFTLVEVLVVASIISLMSSIVLSTLNDARVKVRDSKRIQDMVQVSKALELYRTETGSYPEMSSTTSWRQNSCITSTSLGVTVGQWDAILSNIVSANILPVIPRDPLNNLTIDGSGNLLKPNPHYCYSYFRQSGNSGYWNACRDLQSGQFHFVGDYEYILMYSVENRPLTKGLIYHWAGDSSTNNNANANSRPSTSCYLGPRR